MGKRDINNNKPQQQEREKPNPTTWIHLWVIFIARVYHKTHTDSYRLTHTQTPHTHTHAHTLRKKERVTNLQLSLKWNLLNIIIQISSANVLLLISSKIGSQCSKFLRLQKLFVQTRPSTCFLMALRGRREALSWANHWSFLFEKNWAIQNK